MAKRTRNKKLVKITFEIQPLESDLIAQALDNYRDTLPEGSSYRTRISNMVKLFNADSPDGEYEIL